MNIIQVDNSLASLEVRDATDFERRLMFSLTLKAYAEFENGAPTGFWEKYVSNIEQAVCVTDDIERIVATRDKQIVGCVLLCKQGTNTDYPEIRLLAIDPAFRKMGISRRLMDECETRVKSRGHSQVGLHTTSLMNTARAMYERSGYIRNESGDFIPVPGFVVMGYVKQL